METNLDCEQLESSASMILEYALVRGQMAYKPETIDTSGVSLPAELRQLIERLAQNNHDHWAKKRIEEGWHYGARRNDAKKEHPDLVPYKELPESEKEYDRKTVIEVLKAIIALGYAVRRDC